ncbi:MAG: hypothetical protein J3R72DRAFT_460397 [Linnemannia gamsii]|nr:MAG: hypothetical protein J3R72DRAFT_460397 [Linnemannia gamsii]
MFLPLFLLLLPLVIMSLPACLRLTLHYACLSWSWSVVHHSEMQNVPLALSSTRPPPFSINPFSPSACECKCESNVTHVFMYMYMLLDFIHPFLSPLFRPSSSPCIHICPLLSSSISRPLSSLELDFVLKHSFIPCVLP